MFKKLDDNKVGLWPTSQVCDSRITEDCRADKDSANFAATAYHVILSCELYGDVSP